jgi:hypothetical protein
MLLGRIFAINFSKYINFWNFIFIGNNFRKYDIYYLIFFLIVVISFTFFLIIWIGIIMYWE